MAWLKMESRGCGEVGERHRKIKEMHKKIENRQHNQNLGRREAITGKNSEEGKLWVVGVVQKN